MKESKVNYGLIDVFSTCQVHLDIKIQTNLTKKLIKKEKKKKLINPGNKYIKTTISQKCDEIK